ncbi:hypothetical protein TWF730_009089 [Orbilia blumenaviensis]|uniref:Uncharacterized protein n=1 Tax=Orbilia blumenaviensis TaxID=1796055 RepID=A0AAV9V1A5_9PEZI
MALQKLFAKGDNNDIQTRRLESRENIQAPGTYTPTAADRVLNLPELLEEIIRYDVVPFQLLNDHYFGPYPGFTWKRVNKLRGVSRRWCSIIDSSPRLSGPVFRYPKIWPYVKIEQLKPCGPFFDSLHRKMERISEIKNCGGSNTFPQIEEFTTKIIPYSGYITSDVFVSQPAMEAVYVRFSGYANEPWLEGFEASVRPEDYSRVTKGYDYCYHYKVVNPRGGGVTVKDVVSSLIVVISNFFSFAGEFRNVMIELAFGNWVSLEHAQFLSVIGSQFLWQPNLSFVSLAIGVTKTAVPAAARTEGCSLVRSFDIFKKLCAVFSRA